MNEELKEGVIRSAWKAEPRLVRLLSIVATIVAILAVGAKWLQGQSVANLVLVLVAGGGLLLLIRGLFSLSSNGARQHRLGWLGHLLGAGAVIAFGSALIVGAQVLHEVVEASEGRPILEFLQRVARAPDECSVPNGSAPTIQIYKREDIPTSSEVPPTDTKELCRWLKGKPRLRVLDTIELLEPLTINASSVDLSGRLVLRSNNLTINAIELTGTGNLLAWPEDDIASTPEVPGLRGKAGAAAGNLHVNVIGQTGPATKIRVDLAGQSGGMGSVGVRGPQGSPGDRGRDAADGFLECRRGGGDGRRGGRGGQGGRGGAGGDGGSGGVLTLSDASWKLGVMNSLHFAERRAEGGGRGPGGTGGPGGAGGRGGSGSTFCSGGHRGPAGDTGSVGEPGEPGLAGKPPLIEPAPSAHLI